jgi:acetylornithine deacetylase/succinyl-diaminopimelate desuccinylase-like protein
MKELRAWLEKNRKQIRDDYFEFLRFRSISTETEFKGQVRACAKWVKGYLEKSSFLTELIETPVHPVVFAEKSAGKEKPTVLIYGHYDVQPVDPLELWKSDPFTPTERDGRVYARGAVDDKGQIFYAMVALRALVELGKPLPVNVKFCIEGEEEAASVGLTTILPKIKDKLFSQSLLVVDFDSYDETTPAINLGARGLIAMDVSLSGSNGDLHSGGLGGIAYNPNRALVELLAKLYDENGRVRVDGFYDDVAEASEEEKKIFAQKNGTSYYTKEFGIQAFGGEKGCTVQEANLFRPTVEINGLGGGYFGSGFKTVIPAKSIAKISCRLVPNQDPEKIGQQLIAFLKKHCPKGMKLHAEILSGARAYRAKPFSKLAEAVATASEEATGKTCHRSLTGGSIPVVAELGSQLQADIVGMGYGLPTDQIHAPNEHFDFRRFDLGFFTVARAIERL